MRREWQAVLVWSAVGVAVAGRAEAGWHTTAHLLTPRTSHTATLLPSGKVLVTGGYRPLVPGAGPGSSYISTPSSEIFDPATGAWTATGSLLEGRADHTATLLPSGLVLVVGGVGENARVLASTELFDPVAGTFTAGPPLQFPRFLHSATLLPDGRVLVIGGANTGDPGPEVFDPATGQWTLVFPTDLPSWPKAALLPPRQLPTGEHVYEVLAAYLLGSQRIYRYTRETGDWLEIPVDSLAHFFADTLTLLPSGEVLLTGNDSPRLLDPLSLTARNAGTAPLFRSETATLLPSGRVLLTDYGNSESFDPAASAWTTSALRNVGAFRSTSTLLPGGGLLVTGGDQGDLALAVDDAEIYDEEPGGAWRREPPTVTFFRLTAPLVLLPSGRALALTDTGAAVYNTFLEPPWGVLQKPPFFAPPPLTAADPPLPLRTLVLPSGQLFVTDGIAAWTYDELADGWASLGLLPEGSPGGASVTLLASGKVLVAGVGKSSLDAELFDPALGTWQPTGPLHAPRSFHAATLLASGKVLVAGGRTGEGSPLGTAEVYDPETGAWTKVTPLQTARASATAALLPSGQVLVTGGTLPPSAEIYDPVADSWSTLAPPPTAALGSQATLLPNGKVLVSHGGLSPDLDLYDPASGAWEAISQPGFAVLSQVLLRSGSLLAAGDAGSPPLTAGVYDPAPTDSRRRPSLTPPPPTPPGTPPPPALRYGPPIVLTGTGFRGVSEATSGTPNGTAVDFPLVQLRSLDGTRIGFLPASRPDFSDTQITLDSLPAGSLHPGPHLLSVVVAGVASAPLPIVVDCTAKQLAAPEQTVVPVLGAAGAAATFVAHCAGAERFQWQKDGGDIPGATGAAYTTTPVTAADLGSSYSVVCRSRCDAADVAPSAPTRLQIEDDRFPVAQVLSPQGGELWVLTPQGASTPNQQRIAWSQSDDGLICKVEVKLLAAQDRVHFSPVGGDLFVDDRTGGCTWQNQVTASSFAYSLPRPDQRPGPPNSLYEIEVDVTDEAGHRTAAVSPQPFYLIDPATLGTVQTLILSNLQSLQPTDEERAALTTSLTALANFPAAPGLWLDLSQLPLPGTLANWEACQRTTCDAQTANALVEALRLLLDPLLFVYPNLHYLVLVGDDRSIPFARIPDPTALPESAYTGLTAASTVGTALHGNFYLTDDVLASTRPVPFPASGSGLAPGLALPDLAVGRLVETPAEILGTLATFFAQSGGLDVRRTPEPQVLVTGYDFLTDSAKAIRGDWTGSLGISADGQLLGSSWTAAQLAAKLSRDHRISFLGDHGTHFAAGVPGADSQDIQGLPATALYGIPPPALEGGVVFATGCHGGLPVPGSDRSGSDGDHSLDLPQTFLGLGALAYVASSGYGWGLVAGSGYSERLLRLLSDQIRTGGTVAVGDAVRNAKRSYFLEQLAPDDVYAQKSLSEWTLYGLPMYAVTTGVVPRAAEHPGPVTVTRRPAAAPAAAPPSLTRLDLTFDLSAPGAYAKLDHGGDPAAGVGCPDPQGCYYTLDGVSTGAAGLPLLPALTYDSRLSGTSQHGALWLGGAYVEEKGWTPVLAQLSSNGGPLPAGGSLPFLLQIPPVARCRPRTASGSSCPVASCDFDTLTVVPAQTVASGTDVRHRRFNTVNLEVLYYENGGDDGDNCLRAAPVIPAPATPYHRLNGSTVTWNVPVAAAAGDGVWRVLVLYDLGPDPNGQGVWSPLELAPDGSGRFTGSLDLPPGRSLTYLIEAVSTHGNVGWLASAVAGVSLPTPTAVAGPPAVKIDSPLPGSTFGVGEPILLAGSATDSQGAPLTGKALVWTVLLHQNGHATTVFGPTSGAGAIFSAPPPASLAAAADGYLEIQLAATDAQGRSNTAHQNQLPARVPLTFATQPPGLTVTVDGAAVATPQTFTSWRGYAVGLAAHPQTGAGGESYVFLSWSDGGAPSHFLLTPSFPATTTASFQLSQTAGPFAFNTVPPCRLVDTRLPAGPMGGPALAAGQTRSFTMVGSCQIPRAARAVAVNLTAVSRTGYGYLNLHPAEEPAAATSALNFTPGLTRSNNAILPLGSTGTVAVTYVGLPGTIDLVIDAVGYFE